MHEMSLCEGILEVIEEEAARQSFQQVKQVVLEIGDLAGVEVEAMRFSFDIVMKGTIADAATLTIVQVPGMAKCDSCHQTVSIKQRFDACPACNHYPLTPLSGEELRIKELEVA